MTDVKRHELEIPDGLAGRRLDQALAVLLPDYSRSVLQRWIRDGDVTVGGAPAVPRQPVQGGEQVVVVATAAAAAVPAPQPIPLSIVHEDDVLVVVDKPAGMVVHPAAGNRDGTLVNALLHHAPELAGLPRAGIVHRLDKDTSGLLVVARTLAAHRVLVRQLQARTMGREYLAVVAGRLVSGGQVEGAIGRHAVDRKRMAVRRGGRPAVTHYRVVDRYRGHTLIRVRLDTGRTHQIRVHMAHLRHPVVGDPVYGGRPRPPAGAGEPLRQVLQGFRRQALHAERLSLAHPLSGETVAWQVEPPADLAALIAALERDADAGAAAGA